MSDTHTYMSHVAQVHDVTHSYACHDSLICLSCFTHMCVMTYTYVCHESFVCVSCLIHLCVMTHSSVRHDSHICVSCHGRRRSDLNNCDCQNFKQVFAGVSVNFKQVFTKVNRSPFDSKETPETPVDLQIQTFQVWSPPCVDSLIRVSRLTHSDVSSHLSHTYVCVWVLCHTHMYASCCTLAHLVICRSHGAYVAWMPHMNESWHIWMSHGTYEWVMAHMKVSWYICMRHVTYEWIMARMNESWHIQLGHSTYDWVVAHMYESWRIWMSPGAYEWVMAHINDSWHIWRARVQEEKRLHLESSKQNYYIISFWAIIKAIFTSLKHDPLPNLRLQHVHLFRRKSGRDQEELKHDPLRCGMFIYLTACERVKWLQRAIVVCLLAKDLMKLLYIYIISLSRSLSLSLSLYVCFCYLWYLRVRISLRMWQ